MNYLQWIDEQIAACEKEIARLTIARGVIEQMAETIKVREPNPKTKRGGKIAKGRTRDWILEVMKIMGESGDLPAPSGEISKIVRANHDGLTEKAIWNALYNARTIGAVVRGADGRYSLPPPAEQAA